MKLPSSNKNQVKHIIKLITKNILFHLNQLQHQKRACTKFNTLLLIINHYHQAIYYSQKHLNQILVVPMVLKVEDPPVPQ